MNIHPSPEIDNDIDEFNTIKTVSIDESVGYHFRWRMADYDVNFNSFLGFGLEKKFHLPKSLAGFDVRFYKIWYGDM